LSRVSRLLLGVVGLVMAVFGAMQFWHGYRDLTGSPPSVVTDDRLARIKQAADDFVGLAKGYETTGEAPRASDPKAKPLIDAVFDTSALNTPQPLPHADQQNIAEWLSQVLKVGSVYIFAGTGYTDYSKIAGADAAAQQKLQRQFEKNTVAFAPEIGRYLDAQLNVVGALIWSVAGDIAADPERAKADRTQKGLDQMRNGTVTTLNGAVAMFATDGLSDDWRRARLAPLTAVAPKAAAFLLPDQRKTVHDAALQIAARMTDPSVKSGLAAFAEAVAGQNPAKM